MASITDIAIHLSTSRCIAWIGSGPSIEIGLPSWRRLANEVMEVCRKKQRSGFQAIENLYREGKFPEMFDQVEKSYGREFLVKNCSGLLNDPGHTSVTYKALANLGFLAYFTTNFDDVLLRHINQAGKAFTRYLNSAEDLAAVDVDVTPAVVKLHGDFSDPSSPILTRHDYRRWYRNEGGKGFQTFLRSFLARDRFLFVGYSMSDPEVLQLQEEIQGNLRRKVQSIAILANVPDDEIRKWRLNYNIDILSYRSTNQDHSELSAIMTSLDKVLSIAQVPSDIDSTEELKRAESLYLWYRFSPGHDKTAAVDALQSVTLNLLVDCPNGMTADAIKTQVASSVGVQIEVYEADFERSMDRLIESGWVTASDGRLTVDGENRKIIRTYERKFEEMMKAFEQQVTMDAVNQFGLHEDTGPRFAQLLIDIFQSRGREILRVAFEDTSISPSGALDLIETIWKHAFLLEDPTDRATFVHFTLGTMFEPKGIYENILNYFAKAFFCIQALGANKGINRLVGDVIADRALLVDANILIPLAARHEDRNQFIVAAIEACRAAGIRLYTTKSALDEVRRHANWALNLTQEFRTISPEVLYAATGEGGYESNAFLKGFIAVDPNSRNRSFRQYLCDCFGGSFGRERFDRYFPEQFGIIVLDLMKEINNRLPTEFEQAVLQVRQWNMQRKEEDRKNDLRINSEVEAFIAVTQWDTLKDLAEPGTGSKCSYLTYSSTVSRLGEAFIGSANMISVQSELIWEILTTLGDGADSSQPEFRSLMNASYFRLSDHFIDKERYRTFFRPIIDAAKEELQSIHPFVQEILGINVSDQYLEGYPVEDLPAVLSSVQSAASRKVSLDESVTRKVMEENESLRVQLKEYKDRDEKRKQFVAKQRQNNKKRRARPRIN